MNAINRFDGEHRFLSNFYPSPILFDGVPVATVEHAYQASKTFDPEQRAVIARAFSPGQAKRLGRHVQLRPDWEHDKVLVMAELVRIKFRNPHLRGLLLATGDALLVEGNDWGDTYWGVCRGVGLNMLGKILMIERRNAH